jgi:DNA-binding MarR family transcriptional regulator
LIPASATPESICEVVRLLRPLVLQVARGFDGRLAAYGIAPRGRAVLEFLAENGPQTVPDIARQWTLGRQNVQRIADTLIAHRLVERVENPGHRKSMRVGLTPSGVALVRASRAHEMELIATLTPGLGQSDVEGCRRVLRHLDAGFRFPAAGGSRTSAEFHPGPADQMSSATDTPVTTDG